jgi:hypothetical protein
LANAAVMALKAARRLPATPRLILTDIEVTARCSRQLRSSCVWRPWTPMAPTAAYFDDEGASLVSPELRELHRV